MAISTANSTLLNLPFRLVNAFGTGNIDALRTIGVVEIKSARIVEFAISAANRCFVFARPRTKFSGTFTRSLSIIWPTLRLGLFVIGVTIRWIIRAISWTAISLSNFVGIAFSPSTSCFSLALPTSFFVHKNIVTCNEHPCKPDIFNATYEPAEEE